MQCGQDCANPATDPNHCGGCNDSCEGLEACVGGECECAGDVCDGDCTDLMVDPENCGECGNDCGDGSCTNGVCGCAGDEAECGGECVELDEDNDNCGECGNACGDNQQCVDGACVMGCGGDTPDLCGDTCTDTEIDGQNCGECGNVCGGDEACLEGSCDPGFVAEECNECPCEQCGGELNECCEIEDVIFCAEECP